MKPPVYKVKVGIIGGSGFTDEKGEFLGHKITPVPFQGDEAFGRPSTDLYTMNIGGVETVMIARHGINHQANPSMVNYRANIEALRAYGCTHIISTTACGSLKESLCRGQLLVLDNFIDRTIHRKNTFYDKTSPTNYQGVCHIPMEPAFDPRTSDSIIQAAEELGINVRKGGTTVTIEGPRFSSKAESNLYRSWGADLVNMTTCPEVYLAKEAGLLYASIAMATDYDCWKENEANVSAADVVKVFKQNVDKISKLLVKTVEIIGTKNWDEDIDNLKELIKNSQMNTIKA